MAMSPVLDAAAIAARRDLNGNKTAASTRTRSGASSATNSPRKSKKTIINWLVNSSGNSSADSENNNPKANTNPNPNPNQNPSANQNCSCESRAFRDFRGVQTLRLLWSKRIKSASEEASGPGTHSHYHSNSSSSLGTLKKLNKSVSCLVNAFNNSRDCGTPEKSLAKRAASLHNLQETNTRNLQLQREKDNFYKYKNAEQARMRAKMRSDHSEASEKRLKSDDSTSSPAMAVLSAADKVEPEVEEVAVENEEEEEEQVELRAKQERNSGEHFSLSAASALNGGGGSSDSVNTAHSRASPSISSSVTATSSGTGRSGGRRKYSFKTHAGKSYLQHHHSSRRISSMELTHSSSSGGGGGGGISLVAKLTQQFNEIIQKDARLLEQVKRNNGVWLSRGTHVYKIVEKQPAAESSEEGSRISMVQRNIKKFEKLEKPSVPLKSEQLMRKHQELMASGGSARGSTLSRGPRTKRNLKLPPGSPGIPELAVVSEEVKTPKEPAKQPKLSPTEPLPDEHQEANAEKLRDELNFVAGETEEEEDQRQKQRKHKYATIYEKLRFTFAKGKKSASPSPTKGRSKEEVSLEEEDVSKEEAVREELPKERSLKEEAPRETELRLNIPKEEVPKNEEIPKDEPPNEAIPSTLEDPSPVLPLPPCIDADSKILDALEAVDDKLKVLNPPSDVSAQDGELLLGANNDFEQRILPNNSFVYQAANKQISNNQILLNQAVNVTLVNAIEGEQMIMEQKQLMKDKAAGLKGEQKKEELPEPESIYEPITPIGSETKTEILTSSLFKIVAQKSEIVEDIYQTVEETTKTKTTAKPKLNIWLEGYESIAGSQESSPLAFDGYECIGQEEMASTPIILGTGTLGRNTRDELPELPMRVLPKSATPLRPAPPKPGAKESEEDENIYDTIKGCYESMHCKTSSSSSSSGGATITTDAISLGSNCYESIAHFRKAKMATGQNQGSAGSCIQLSSSGSTLTISSDHKTNSLYESSLAANGCVVYGSASVGCRSSVGSSAGSRDSGKPGDKRSSIAGSSDNSDAWVDISDGEHGHTRVELATEAQFIVVRERFKPHRTRSPDWSKRIRDKRLQKKAISCIEDDSDHYYETLSPLGNKRHSTQLLRPNQEVVRTSGIRASQRRSKNHSASALALGEHVVISDDYDSFETDSDDPGEGEPDQQQRNHNDSGVDMRNHRLPKPPPAQNQVYEFVRKFRDFISSKKSPKGSQQKLYENTTAATQFYVESGKRPAEVREYENTEYGPERNTTTTNPHQELPPVMRAKQKNGKSLRSRIRKSLVGSSFDTKHLDSLAETRSTFYVEDPEGLLPTLQLPSPEIHGSGELDSGFCEKACTPTAESQKFSTVARKAKKEAKATRRRTTIGLRPHDPPPPPPPPIGGSKTPTDTELREQEPGQTTSWYAECGVFKQASNSLNSPRGDEPVTPTPSAGGISSWYAESGLYQTSGISVASSSGSSGVSTGNEAGLGDELNPEPHSLFSNEPLYQMYSAAKLESITRDLEAHEGSADGYEEIGQHAKQKTEPLAKPRPTALQLVEPKNGPSRTLWSEIPEVIQSCILPTLTSRERSLQEAKFEIITSEASYLKSLNLLRRHFMNHSAFVDTSVLSGRDRKALFSYIVPVHECSERLLTELEACWQDNIMLLGLSRCIYEIAERHFHVYVAFCEHQGRMDRTLRRLKESKESSAFQQHLERLEQSPSCCGLNLHSFLMLPMQRITRLPLLIDAVFSKESPLNREEYESWKLTLALVQKIVAQCNEAANRWEQAYELERIARQLEFPSHIRALAIAPMGVPRAGAKPRFLVKRGELTHLIWRGEDAKLTFGKRLTKASIYAFLFSDLLVLCKRRGESYFTVFDYCPRSMLTLAAGDTLPTKDLKDQAGKNLILMTLLENCERKTVELLLSCPSVSDQQRWLQAMRPPEAETPGEKLYESWDCPQVVAKHSYESDEPDVLQLELGDVVNVSRKLPDGWYQGERIRDGAVGWFPGSYTEELNSAHVRARNLKQRHRLLTFTATYLEAQKSK